MSKSVTQSEEEIKQMIIDSLKDIEWDIMQGKTDAVMTKLDEAQKLAREWRVGKTQHRVPWDSKAHACQKMLKSYCQRHNENNI